MAGGFVEAADHGGVGIDGMDVGLAGQWQGECADTAKQIGDAFGFADGFEHMALQNVLGLVHGLEKGFWREMDLRRADCEEGAFQFQHRFLSAGDADQFEEARNGSELRGEMAVDFTRHAQREVEAVFGLGEVEFDPLSFAQQRVEDGTEFLRQGEELGREDVAGF